MIRLRRFARRAPVAVGLLLPVFVASACTTTTRMLSAPPPALDPGGGVAIFPTSAASEEMASCVATVVQRRLPKMRIVSGSDARVLAFGPDAERSMQPPGPDPLRPDARERLQAAATRVQLAQPQSPLDQRTDLPPDTPLSLQTIIDISAELLEPAARQVLPAARVKKLPERRTAVQIDEGHIRPAAETDCGPDLHQEAAQSSPGRRCSEDRIPGPFKACPQLLRDARRSFTFTSGGPDNQQPGAGRSLTRVRCGKEIRTHRNGGLSRRGTTAIFSPPLHTAVPGPTGLNSAVASASGRPAGDFRSPTPTPSTSAGSALLIGAGYTAGAYFFARLILDKKWHRVQAGFLPITAFTKAERQRRHQVAVLPALDALAEA